MYIDPLALDVSKYIPENQQPDVYYIWYAQVGLWIQRDVADSLAAVNAEAKNVLDAPVKRLMKIDVVEQQSGLAFVTDQSVASNGRSPRGGSGGGMMPGMMGMRGGYESSEPAAAAAPGGAVPKDFTLSPTGRVSSTAAGFGAFVFLT